MSRNHSLCDALAAALRRRQGHDPEPPTRTCRAAEREQWDDGNNFLAVAPGVVMGYERNVPTNTILRNHGIEVVTWSATSSAAAAAVRAA